jgi:hypothetical protein
MDLIRKWWWVVLVGVVVGLGVVNFNSLILKGSGKTTGGGTVVSGGKTQMQAGNKLVAVDKHAVWCHLGSNEAELIIHIA